MKSILFVKVNVHVVKGNLIIYISMKRSAQFLLMVFMVLPTSGFSQTESDILKQLFVGPEEIIKQSEELISLSVDAVWYASEVTGYTTITGTLTQNTSNYDYWAYSADPDDKMVLIFANGDIIEFVFYAIDGFVDGTSDDFKLSHAMDFTSVITNQMDLRIQSDTRPQNDRIEWGREISGTTTIDSDLLTVNITNNGYQDVVNEHGIALGDFYHETSGTINSSNITYSINENYFTKIGHDSNKAIYIQSRQIRNSNSASGTFGSFQFNNVDCFWVGGSSIYEGEVDENDLVYNEVIESYNWSAAGSLLKNNVYYGDINFDRPIVDGSNGAYIVADCTDGTQFNLYPALTPNPLSDNSIEHSLDLTMDYYPNPTTSDIYIFYSIPVSSNVELILMNQNGVRLKTILMDHKPAGMYNIEISLGDLPNGLYLLQISNGEKRITKKVVKL